MTSSEKKAKKKATAARQRRARKVAGRYYLTPKVWAKRCSHCAGTTSVAYRQRGRVTACAACIERLRIVAHESRAWRDGGAQAGAEVRIYRLAPPTTGHAPTGADSGP